MWDFVQSLLFNPIMRAMILGLVLANLLLVAFRAWIGNELSKGDSVRSHSGEAHQDQILRALGSGTVVSQLGVGLNGVAGGVTLLLFAMLVSDHRNSAEIVDVFVTFLVGIAFGIVAVIGAHVAGPVTKKTSTPGFRVVVLICGIFALCHFLSGSVQLIDTLLAIA